MPLLYSLHQFLLKKIHWLFYFLIYKNEQIHNEYERFIRLYDDVSLWERYKKVFQLNWHYRVKKIFPFRNTKNVVLESAGKKLSSANELIKRLSEYDLISFDVFDTLIFRACNPYVVFQMLEHQLMIFDFANIRLKAEREVAQKKKNYTLEDIYLWIERELKFPHQKGIGAEIKMEQNVCYANPYMQTVFQKLFAMNKQIIFTTDMYLPKAVIRSILTNCGYSEECPVFLSCDIDRQKSDGTMFEYLKSLFPDKKMIHIGDNMHADYNMAKESRIDALLYPNYNHCGIKFRDLRGMDKITASVYSAVVNAKMHSDEKEFSGAYEYGYIYGGFLIHSFCQWLMEQKKLYSIDALLLIARDGDILNQYFSRFYNDVEREYVLWSRTAAFKYATGDNFNLFWDKTVTFPTKSTLKEMIEYYGIGSLKIFPESEWDLNIIPDKETLLKFKEKLAEKWLEIQVLYQKQCSAYCQYLKKIIGDRRRIALVDLGWDGISLVSLSKIIHKNFPGTEIHILLYAGNHANTTCKNYNIRTFAFSNSINADLRKDFLDDRYSITLLEILFDSLTLSYLGIEKSGNSFHHFFAQSYPENNVVISEVARGILDFSADFIKKESFFSDHYLISGRDSLIPILKILKQKAFFAKYLSEYKSDSSMVDTLFHKSPVLSQIFSHKSLW